MNKVILSGRFTATPELKQTQNGTSVTSFTLAVNRKMDREKVDFLDCIAWRGTAEFLTKYFAKGDPVVVEGELQKREWQTKEGQKRYATEVIVSNAEFSLSKKSDEPKSYVPEAYKPQFEEVKTDDDSDLPF